MHTFKRIGGSGPLISFNDERIVDGLNDLKQTLKGMGTASASSTPQPLPNIVVHPNFDLSGLHLPPAVVQFEPKIDLPKFDIPAPIINYIPVATSKLLLANLILLSVIATISVALFIHILK